MICVTHATQPLTPCLPTTTILQWLSLSFLLSHPRTPPYSSSVPFSIGADPVLEPRKRTTSFSCPSSSPRPRKRLHRTESNVDLTALASPVPSSPEAYATPLTTPPAIPYNRTLKHYKEQKDRKKGSMRLGVASSSPLAPPRSCATRSPASALFSLAPATTPAPIPLTAQLPRQPPTSPLARGDGSARALLLPTPASACLACGPAHPPPPTARTRAKAKVQAADLHRRALTACMRESPEGAKILRMGARLAVEIMSATMELERLCGDDLLSDEDAMGEIDVDEEDVAEVEAMVDDVDMEDIQTQRQSTPEPEPVMSASWVVIAGQPIVCGREIAREYGQKEDWEMVMVECVA
ncbi:hypothetical protein MKEN_00317400 [Mycena kentingensis (nom. inval.)]|nr:hypothetical protein MKEN_00317400 [Mycena kentingensis (nom. inval.)]